MLQSILQSIFAWKTSIICADPDTLLNKWTELIPSVTTEINFCWPTLRNNCLGMVFNYLPQFLDKNTEQNDIFFAAVFC